MIKKFIYLIQYSFIFFLLFLNSAYSADVTITGTQTTREDLQADSTLTIQSGGSLVNTNLNNIARGYIAAGNEIDGATIVVESNASIEGKSNAIMGRETNNLTITNSGTITVSSSKAINLRDSQNTTITNKKGGTISANTNAIVQQSVGTENAENVTISNSGTISSVENRSIYFYDGATGTTLTNNSSGVIFNTSDFTTVQLDTSSTLTNSGTIENRNGPSNNSITLAGNNNTITLKDGGKVIGTIAAGSTTGNTLKIQHGVGQSYFYETSGNDMTLQDLDGNQIVRGSASSVGQGGSENIDELLGYKSIAIRKSLDKYLNSEDFKNEETSWQGLQVTHSERKENKQKLALGYSLNSLAVNILRPIENKNSFTSLEYSQQDFQKDHNIIRYNLSQGFHFNDEIENKFFKNTYILLGATLNDSERKILTNTTSSGTDVLTDTYLSSEMHAGKKFNTKYNLPKIGTNFSYSYTPGHSETKFYHWEAKSVANISLDISDEYIFKTKNSKFSFGWMLDFRQMINGDKQKYKVKSTTATYTQDNELTNEASFSANLNYEKNLNIGKILLSLDGLQSTQEVTTFSGNIFYIIKI